MQVDRQRGKAASRRPVPMNDCFGARGSMFAFGRETPCVRGPLQLVFDYP